jgi:SAM-dependent methyltransferase
MTMPLFASELSSSATSPASLARSNEQYAVLARRYDALTPRLEPLRQEAHALLHLRPGDTVMDVGCGTGKSLAALSHAVGVGGRVIAVEPCAPMIAQARERCRCEGGGVELANVLLIEAQIEAVAARVPAHSVDAFLLMFTHDVLQSEAAINALLRMAKPGARFALTGGKFFRGPLALLNPWVKWRQQPYCTTFVNYDAPWRRLFALCGMTATHWQARYGGIAYIASAQWNNEWSNELTAEPMAETVRANFTYNRRRTVAKQFKVTRRTKRT